MSATTRRVRLFTAAGLALACAAAAPAPSVAAPPPGFFYLTFQDRLPNTWQLTSDFVSFEYVGRRPASARPRLRLVRNGVAIVETSSNELWGAFETAPPLSVGDVLQVQDEVTGEGYASATFNGRPAFLQGTCGAVTELPGLRTPGAELSGVGAYDPAGGNEYGGHDETRIDATFVGDGPGSDFDVEFDKPVKAGFRVWAEEHYTVADNASVRTFREQRVRTCDEPVPPPPAALPKSDLPAGAAKDQRAPVGAVNKPSGLSKRSIAQLLKGPTFTVLSDEAGAIDATVTLRTTRKGKKKLTPLGGITQTAKQGKNAVRVPMPASAKKPLKAARGSSSARIVFGFTLRDAAGNRTPLPSFTLKVPRR